MTSWSGAQSTALAVPGLPALHWEVLGFFRDVKNLIDYDTFDPITNQDVFGNVAGVVRVRGGEIA
ncbi:MAG: hypothetical protein ACXVDI_25930, partial [Ktedonobacterales bacterium]